MLSYFFPLYLKTDRIQRLSRLASGHACYDAKMQRCENATFLQRITFWLTTDTTPSFLTYSIGLYFNFCSLIVVRSIS